MYCSACGVALTPGLSYCNRCGISLSDRTEPPKVATVVPFLTAIAVVAMAGAGLMLAGALALKNGGHFGGEIIGPYMVMVFTLVTMVEIYLCRMLSRVTLGSKRRDQPQLTTVNQPLDLRAPHQRVLPEPLPSVTENTTRTLQYQESSRR